MSHHNVENERTKQLSNSMTEGPTRKAWEAVLSSLEQCSAEKLPEFLAFLKPYMEHWDTQNHESWEPGDRDTGLYPHFWQDVPEYRWGSHIGEGEVRVAPHPWLTKMLQGQDLPQWELIRQLHLDALFLKGKQANALLQLEHLNRVQSLSLCYNGRIPATFFKQLLKSPQMKHLQRLALSVNMKPNCWDALHRASIFALTTLALFDNGDSTEDNMNKLVSAASLQSIETLELLHPNGNRMTFGALQRNPALFPELKHLKMKMHDPESNLPPLLESGILSKLESMKLGIEQYFPEFVSQFFQKEGLPQLKRLDIQGFSDTASFYHDETVPQQIALHLRKWLPESGLLPQLEEVTLGDFGDDALRELLASHDVTVL